MKQRGLFWHVHHLILLEWCDSYDERAAYINTQKAVEERELRIRLFQPVKGVLPEAVLKAGDAYNKARTAYNEAGDVFNEAHTAFDKAHTAFDKARTAYNEAGNAYNKACITLDREIAAHLSEIEALHKQECPNCPWNGETIFP